MSYEMLVAGAGLDKLCFWVVEALSSLLEHPDFIRLVDGASIPSKQL